MRHRERTFSTDRDSERKIMRGEGKNGKKKAMGKMGGAKRLKFKGQREIQDSLNKPLIQEGGQKKATELKLGRVHSQ